MFQEHFAACITDQVPDWGDTSKTYLQHEQ